MKIALKIVALLSVQFTSHFGDNPATNTLIFLVLFSLLSIILVGMKDIFPPRIRVVFAVAQALAFALYVSQLL